MLTYLENENEYKIALGTDNVPSDFNNVRQACRLANRWKSVVEVDIANHIEKHKLSIVR